MTVRTVGWLAALIALFLHLDQLVGLCDMPLQVNHGAQSCPSKMLFEKFVWLACNGFPCTDKHHPRGHIRAGQ